MGFVCYTNSGFLKMGTNWLFSFMLPILSQTKALDLFIKGNISGNKNILIFKMSINFTLFIYHSKVLFIKNQFSNNPTFKIIPEVSHCKKKGDGESFNKLLTTLEKIHKNKLFNHSVKLLFKNPLLWWKVTNIKHTTTQKDRVILKFWTDDYYCVILEYFI